MYNPGILKGSSSQLTRELSYQLRESSGQLEGKSGRAACGDRLWRQ